MFKPYLLSLSLFLRRFILTLPFASRHSNFTNIMLLLVFISRHDIFQFTLSLYIKKFRIFFQFSQCLVCSFSEKSKQFPCDVVSTGLDPGCYCCFFRLLFLRIADTQCKTFTRNGQYWNVLWRRRILQKKLIDLNNWRACRRFHPFLLFFCFGFAERTNCFLSPLKLVSSTKPYRQIIKLCIIFGRGLYKYPIINNVCHTYETPLHVFRRVCGWPHGNGLVPCYTRNWFSYLNNDAENHSILRCLDDRPIFIGVFVAVVSLVRKSKVVIFYRNVYAVYLK